MIMPKSKNPSAPKIDKLDLTIIPYYYVWNIQKNKESFVLIKELHDQYGHAHEQTPPLRIRQYFFQVQVQDTKLKESSGILEFTFILFTKWNIKIQNIINNLDKSKNIDEHSQLKVNISIIRVADIWLKYGLKYYPIDQSIIRQKLLERKTKNEQDFKERARKALKTQIPNAPQVQN